MNSNKAPLASAGKCPAVPAAPLPGNFSPIFFAGNDLIFRRRFLPSLSKLCAAKIEIYHYYEQNCTSLKSIYSMQEVLLMTCTGNFYF